MPLPINLEFPKANGAVEQSVVLNGGTELRDPEHTEINCGNPVRVRKRHPSWELIYIGYVVKLAVNATLRW